MLIIWLISKNYNRFSQLKGIIPDISKQLLVNQLREVEGDTIPERITYAENQA